MMAAILSASLACSGANECVVELQIGRVPIAVPRIAPSSGTLTPFVPETATQLFRRNERESTKSFVDEPKRERYGMVTVSIRELFTR